MQFYGISFVHPYKQSGGWQDVLGPASNQTAYMDALKNYHKTACTCLPEDEFETVEDILIELNH